MDWEFGKTYLVSANIKLRRADRTPSEIRVDDLPLTYVGSLDQAVHRDESGALEWEQTGANIFLTDTKRHVVLRDEQVISREEAD